MVLRRPSLNQGNTEQTRFRVESSDRAPIVSVIRDFDTSLAANRVSFDIESFTTGYLIRRNNRDFSSYSHRDRRENGNNRSIFSLLYSSRIYRYSICTLSYYSFLLVIIRDSLIHRCNYRI